MRPLAPFFRLLRYFALFIWVRFVVAAYHIVKSAGAPAGSGNRACGAGAPTGGEFGLY